MRLQEKATALINKFQDGSHSPNPNLDSINNQDLAVDELAIFGGQTHVLFIKKLLQKLPNRDADAGASPSLERLPSSGGLENTPSVLTHPASDQDQEDMSMQYQDVHPSLMEYISMLSSTTEDGATTSPQYMEQSGAGEIAGPFQYSAGPSQFSAGLPNPDFFPLAEYSMQQAEHTQNTPMMDFTYDSNLFGPFAQFYREASLSSAPADMLEANDIGLNNPNIFPDINDPRAYGVTDNRWI